MIWKNCPPKQTDTCFAFLMLIRKDMLSAFHEEKEKEKVKKVLHDECHKKVKVGLPCIIKLLKLCDFVEAV